MTRGQRVRFGGIRVRDQLLGAAAEVQRVAHDLGGGGGEARVAAPGWRRGGDRSPQRAVGGGPQFERRVRFREDRGVGPQLEEALWRQDHRESTAAVAEFWERRCRTRGSARRGACALAAEDDATLRGPLAGADRGHV